MFSSMRDQSAPTKLKQQKYKQALNATARGKCINENLEVCVIGSEIIKLQVATTFYTITFKTKRPSN